MNIEEYKQKFLDKDCVILTCGPSLKEYSKEKISDFIKDKIVICVKESIVEYKDHAHFFFWNNTRPRTFNINSNTIKVYQTNDISNNNYRNHPADIILPEDTPFHSKNQLLKKKNFKDYELENNIKRPWGPGILYESVFYFCKYIGIKNIYTIGWDLIDKNNYTTITHYFDNDSSNDYEKSVRFDSNNDRLNKQFYDEMIMVNKNIVDMYDYFKQEGMNIYVVGSQSSVNEHIPRINLQNTQTGDSRARLPRVKMIWTI